MLALRCVWHQVNNYRVLCSWLHMANAGQNSGGTAANPYINMSSDIYMGGSVPDPESGEMDLARSRPGHLPRSHITFPVSPMCTTLIPLSQVKSPYRCLLLIFLVQHLPHQFTLLT